MASSYSSRQLPRRSFLLALSVSGAGALLAACSGPTPTPASGTATTPGSSSSTAPAAPTTAPAQQSATPSNARIVLGLARTQPSMDPGAVAGGNSVGFYLPIYETLTRVEVGGKISPLLAESWEQTNPTTWRFKLRDNVKFHNGDPFTAESVKFTIDRARDPNNALAALSRLGDVAEVKIVDRLTIDIVTKAPNVILPNNMSLIFIGSERYFAQAGAEAYANRPVGTGPWRMTAFTVNEHYAFDRNPDYWGPQPAIKEIEINVVPEAAARISGLMTGEIDIIEGVTADHIAQIESSGQAKTVSELVGTVAQFALNYKLPGLSDQRVRQALNYAIDKEQLLQSLFAGRGKISGGQVVGSDCFGYDPSLAPYPYDPDRAKQLLTEAGFSSGLEFEANVVADPTVGEDLALAIAAQYERIGVKMNVARVDFAVFRDQFYGQRERPGAMSLLLSYDPQYDAHFVFNWFTEDAAGEPLWQVPEEFAQLWKQQVQEPDRAKREQMLQRMSGMLREGAPTIVLWQNDRIYGVRKDIEWQPGPGVVIDFRNARRA